MSLSDVAKTGDTTATLEALRDRLAEEIEASNSGRDIAALSARFLETVKLLEGNEAPAEETAVERIARRAEERRAAAQKATGADESG